MGLQHSQLEEEKFRAIDGRFQEAMDLDLPKKV
jgi:hypothetical protein